MAHGARRGVARGARRGGKVEVEKRNSAEHIAGRSGRPRQREKQRRIARTAHEPRAGYRITGGQ